jgi:hypothetical protein
VISCWKPTKEEMEEIQRPIQGVNMVNKLGLAACLMALVTIDVAFALDFVRLAVLEIFTYSERIQTAFAVWRSGGPWGAWCTVAILIIAFTCLIPIGMSFHFLWPDASLK